MSRIGGIVGHYWDNGRQQKNGPWSAKDKGKKIGDHHPDDTRGDGAEAAKKDSEASEAAKDLLLRNFLS